jgi:hypothetical protein
MSQNLYDPTKMYPRDTYSTGGSFGGEPEGFSTGGSFGGEPEPAEGLTPGNGTKAISKPKDALAAYLKARKKGSMGGGAPAVPMPQPRPQGLGVPPPAPPNPYGGHTYSDATGSYNIPQGNDGAPMQMIGGPGPSSFPNAGMGVQNFMGNMGKAMTGQPMQLPMPQQGLQNAPATLGGLAGQGSPIAMLAKLFGG